MQVGNRKNRDHLARWQRENHRPTRPEPENRGGMSATVEQEMSTNHKKTYNFAYIVNML